jgi:ribosome-associated heat shock protein Hsp15
VDRQRIDKWLWNARVVRTRSASAALVASGHVRLNGRRIDATSQPVRAGDVITIALDRAVRILKVANFAERRGNGEAGRTLYVDLTPESAPVPVLDPSAAGDREPGAGRPTKRERRAIDRLQNGEE